MEYGITAFEGAMGTYRQLFPFKNVKIITRGVKETTYGWKGVEYISVCRPSIMAIWVDKQYAVTCHRWVFVQMPAKDGGVCWRYTGKKWQQKRTSNDEWKEMPAPPFLKQILADLPF